MVRRHYISLLALCVSLAVLTSAYAGTPLPKDPNNVYGQFENGLKYIVRPHNNPPGRAILYIHIDAGALDEKEDQNGIAHFMEHMSFNGSKHFPPGDLLKDLGKLGMEFGEDVNAHTSQSETVFKLTMPDAKDETIEKALTVLADYANGLLLTQEEIDNERGVILEEARAGKSARERIRTQKMEKVFSGSRLATHDVIGDEDQIAKWNKDQFDDFYNTWYRPELITFVFVGDVDATKVIAKAREHLGSFKGRAPGRKAGTTGVKPVKETRAFVLTDPEQVRCRVEMLSIQPGKLPAKTVEEYRAEWIEEIGTWMFSKRMSDKVNEGTAAYVGAGAFMEDLFHEAIMPTAVAIGQPEDWDKMLDQLIVELDRVIEHGFTERELTLAKKEILSQLERAVEIEPTLDASRIMRQLTRTVGQGEAILSAEQEFNLASRILNSIKLDEAAVAFRKAFQTEHYAYVITMPEKKEGLEVPSSTGVLTAAAEVWARKTESLKETKDAEAILLKMPKPGKVVSKTADADLKVTTVTFDNGVVMHHRFMDYKKEQVLVTLTLPGGSIEESASTHGYSDVASLAFSQPATSRLSSNQIQDLMIGTKINVGGGIGEDALFVSVAGAPADLDVGMQLAHALITDGKIEQSAFDNFKKQTVQMIEAMKKQPQGYLMKDIAETFHGGDVRLARLTLKEVDQLNPEVGQAWLKRIVDTAAIEVSVVGEITEDEAIDMVARYVGSLPKRKGGFRDLDPLRTVKRDSGPYGRTTHFESVTPKAIVLAGYVGCERSNVLDRRLLQMASQILSERMVKEIREEKRLVYSIGCMSAPASAYQGKGIFGAFAPTDPETADTLADAIYKILGDFADKGPTDEEVSTARKQIVVDLEKQMREPRFWSGQLSDMVYRDRSFDEMKKIADAYQGFTAKQLQDVVQRYCKDDKQLRFIVIPDKPVEEKGESIVDEKPEEKKPVAVGE